MESLNPILLQRVAARHALPPGLVGAIITQESGGNPWAWNPEPRYRYFWDVKRKRPFRAVSAAENASEKPPPDFPTLAADPDQEWWAQQASWGVMQVMGAVARESGFAGPYLTQLCDVLENLEYGCRHLKRLTERFFPAHNWAGVVAAYNAGSPRMAEAGRYANQEYVDAVMGRFTGAPTGALS